MEKLKFISVIFCLFQLLSCNSQNKVKLGYQNDNLLNEIGIGLVQQVVVTDKIVLYKNPDCKTVISKNSKIGKELIPLLYKIDYNILFFVCVEKNKDYYKIVISSGKYAYLKSSQNYLFYNWNEFLKNQVISLESKDLEKNPFVNKINGNPINIKIILPDDEIEIVEVKNEWAKIHNTTLNSNYFIKWRDKQNLLVFLSLLL